jgi:hypothetical protein
MRDHCHHPFDHEQSRHRSHPRGQLVPKFIPAAAELFSEARGSFISNDEALYSVHQAAAEDSTVPLPEVCDTHFATFVRLDGRLWELDGRKALFCHGPVDDILKSSLKVIKNEYMVRIQQPDSLRISILALTALPPE